MARPVSPPTLNRVLARASTALVNPAALLAIQQRAPIKSAASKTIKARCARPSLILSSAPRTTLRAAATAMQRAQPTRDELAVASKTNPPGACIRALQGKKIVDKKTADNDQKKNVQNYSRIPMLKRANDKWMKPRKCVATVCKKTAVKNKDKKTEVVKNISHINAVTYVDNNPDLLEDVSFDESIPGGVQSHYTHFFSRMDLRVKTRGQGGRIARIPRNGGDFFMLPRQRRPVWKAIAIKPGTTTRYLGKLLPQSNIIMKRD